MSAAERRRRSRANERLCARCKQRRAKYQYRGHVRADRQHVLCFRCFRSERERIRARELAGTVMQGTATVFSGASENGACPPYSEHGACPRFPRELTLAQIAHRRLMLAHLESLAR